MRPTRVRASHCTRTWICSRYVDQQACRGRDKDLEFDSSACSLQCRPNVTCAQWLLRTPQGAACCANGTPSAEASPSLAVCAISRHAPQPAGTHRRCPTPSQASGSTHKSSVKYKPYLHVPRPLRPCQCTPKVDFDGGVPQLVQWLWRFQRL